MERRFADVEYFGMVYQDAELIGGLWCFYDGAGGFGPFHAQWRVRLLNEPQGHARHPGGGRNAAVEVPPAIIGTGSI